MIVQHQTFLLSPADCGGPRAMRLLRRLDIGHAEDLSLADGFREISALYFRGKLEYARRFARPRSGQVPVWVITPSRGIRPATDPLNSAVLREFGAGEVHQDDRRYRAALDASLAQLGDGLTENDRVVFLGSIATRKYVDALSALEERVSAPAAFRGLGNMQRGSMLRRCALEGNELAYVALAELV